LAAGPHEARAKLLRIRVACFDPTRHNLSLIGGTSRSLVAFSFLSHPLLYVSRAIHDLHSVGLTRSQESNHLDIHERHFLQVENKLRSVLLELPFQFLDVLRLEVTNQTNRGLSASRILFDLQSPLASIGALSSRVRASGMPTQSVEAAGLTAREIADFREMLIFRQN
jgi:hypothetical protein